MRPEADALLDRLPIWPERHDLRAVLGRAVPDWRHSVIRRGRDLADPPMLVAAAPTLDRAAVAMTQLGDLVVTLVGIGDRRDLRPEQKGMHPKNIARLAPLLSDPRLRQQFYDLPERLMRRAIAMDELKGGRQPAVIAQLAVAPELWQTVPVRIANMVSLELERHFPTLAIREGHAVIVIPGEEMKNGKPQTYR